MPKDEKKKTPPDGLEHYMQQERRRRDEAKKPYGFGIVIGIIFLIVTYGAGFAIWTFFS